MNFKYHSDPLENAKLIIGKFIDRRFPLMPGIKGNKIVYTDVSTSTLAWVEDNVVFELYYMHPNVEVITHSHPFRLTSIFLNGDLRGWINYKQDTPWLTQERIGVRGPIHEKNTPHGFIIGSRGASFYTIQIWDQIVTDPKSATEEYIGEPLGPLHSSLQLK